MKINFLFELKLLTEILSWIRDYRWYLQNHSEGDVEMVIEGCYFYDT